MILLMTVRMEVMKAHPSVPIEKQVATSKSTGAAGLTIGLMTLTGYV